MPLLLAKEGEDTSENMEIDPMEVRRLMRKLNTHKVHGPDGISPFVLKKCEKTLVRPLGMYKISLNEGNVPTEWK